MLVFAREVFVCKCSTDVARAAPDAGEMASRLRFSEGTAADIERVDPEHHNDEHKADLASRLERGEHWLVGEVDGEIVTYTWLHNRNDASYPTLPGCDIVLSDDCGYGYDAWTPPELRGQGLRRVAFLEELNILREKWGCNWEASFFVKHQLDGATRSLAKVGIEVVPLWRVYLQRDRSLGAEKLRDDPAATPAFLRPT